MSTMYKTLIIEFTLRAIASNLQTNETIKWEMITLLA